MSLFQNIREKFNPNLKCRRLGHTMRPKKAEILVEFGSPYTEVASYHTATVDCCSRCGFHENAQIEKYLRGLTGLSMGKDRWDELRDKGYLLHRWMPLPPAPEVK